MGFAPVLEFGESKEYMKLNTVLVLIVAATLCLGSASYTGYSGAPGTPGTCAAYCHGTGGGTISVSGFPLTYTPGQAYVITVAHDGGSSIENFNASVRVGTGTQNAGTIESGTNTVVYNVGGETNGVHFGTPGQASGTFTWTAPSPGVGTVKLYLAGHQSSSSGGPNTEIVLTADGTGVAEPGRGTMRSADFRLEQSIVTDQLVLRIDNPQAPARIRIIDRNGRVVSRQVVAAGSNQAIVVPLLNSRGQKLAAGSYYATFATPGAYRVAKFSVVAR